MSNALNTTGKVFNHITATETYDQTSATSPELLHEVATYKFERNARHVSTADEYIYTSGANGVNNFTRIRPGIDLQEMQGDFGHEAPVVSVVASQDVIVTATTYRVYQTDLQQSALKIHNLDRPGNPRELILLDDHFLVVGNPSLLIGTRSMLRIETYNTSQYILAVSPDQQRVSFPSCDHPGAVIECNLINPGNHPEVLFRADPIWSIFSSIAYNFEGETVVSQFVEGESKLLLLDSPEPRTLWTGKGKVAAIAVSSEGILAVGVTEKRNYVALLDKNGVEIQKLDIEGPVNSLAFRHDGTLVAAGKTRKHGGYLTFFAWEALSGETVPIKKNKGE